MLLECTDHQLFAYKMYTKQTEGGDYFVHEHPESASSWELKQTLELLNKPGVFYQRMDQCEVGAVLPKPGGGEGPVQ